MTTALICTVPLPNTFRPADILAFHRRDVQEISERVTGTSLQKGVIWRNLPACLTIRFDVGSAEAQLSVDGRVPRADSSVLAAMTRRMLGLDQGIDEFEARYREHPQLGGMIARQSGLRVPVAATPFEALTWAVTGQQISVGAAVSLRRKLVAATGVRHSAGLLCYPEAWQIARLDEETLRGAGFSRTKAETLLTLSRLVAEERLPLDDWLRALPPADVIREQLGAVRGIGPWTISYTLLRGFGWLDGSLHGDVAVRRGLQVLLGSPDKVGEEEAKLWLAGFSPWRALVGAHLWAAQSAAAY